MPILRKVLYEDGRYPFLAAIAMGDVVVRPCGTLAIFDGFDAAAIGDRVNPDPIHVTKVCEFPALTTDTWAVGTVLYWDAVNFRLTATVGSNKRVGVATTAKTNGQVTHVVNCTQA